MGVLRDQHARYLDFRRRRGFALDGAAGMVDSFLIFLERRGEEVISRGLFARWNTMYPASHMSMERRSIAVRNFVKWLRIFDLRHQIPPRYRGLLGKNRPTPHIYTDAEMVELFKKSARLSSPRRIRALTYPVLWALLYVTGVRIGEALAIDVAHIDFNAGTILIPAQKGSYDRLVPLDPTAVEALKKFQRRRNRLLGAKPECLFTDENGRRLRYPAVG
jgi:site-specific recombinase XerD